MTAAIVWRMEWEWAGASGVAYDIDPQWVQRASLYSSDAGIRSVTLRWVPGIDVAALVQAGHHPYTGTATLYAGDDVVIGGVWRGVEYGEDGDPIGITITESEADDAGRLPVEGTVYNIPDRADAPRRYVAPYARLGALAKRVASHNFPFAATRALAAAGLRRIEARSCVSPKAVPQLADAAEVAR